MLSRLLALALVACATSAEADAPAQPWYRGEAGKKRILHLSLAVGGGLLYFGANFAHAAAVDSDACRWCEPPLIDDRARDLFVWDNTRAADIASSVIAYGAAPVLGIGLLYLSDRDASLPRFLDDTIPVFETVVYTQLLVNTMKMAFGRQRPFVRYGSEVAFEVDHNKSFPSGHAALGFAITTSAGMICHWRGYWTEPYVWGVGITLSIATEYLRIAADKHYLTDVLVGGGIGIIGGITIPRFFKDDVKIVPVKNGVGIATTF